MSYDVMFHEYLDDDSILIACDNAINYKNAMIAKDIKMSLVANAKAVKKLVKGNFDIESRIKEAVASGLEVKVCQNAINKHGIKAEDLFDCCTVVSAGILEIVNLKNSGYCYIKP